LLARELPLDPSPVDGGTVLDDLMNIVKNFPDETPNGRLALSCIEADVCKQTENLPVCSIFQNLQYLRTLAPLRAQHLQNFGLLVFPISAISKISLNLN
jgi:hypothetical protein